MENIVLLPAGRVPIFLTAAEEIDAMGEEKTQEAKTPGKR